MEGAAVLRMRSGMTYRMLVIQRNVVLTDHERAAVDAWRAAGLPVFEARGIYDPVPVPFAPDLDYRSAHRLDDCVRFCHRRLADADVYFLYNHSREAFSQEISARSPFRRAYRWDPLDGSMEDLGAAGSRAFRLRLEPDESAFVVVTDLSLEGAQRRNAAGMSREIPVEGPWRVQFDPAMGGPAKPVRFRELSDWTENPDPRIRYFSGTASYSTVFRRKAGSLSTDRQYLQLTLSNGTARVFVNGREAGTIWCAPWQLDITPYLRPGRNELRLEVVNPLYNRMIGDAIEHPDGKGAFTRSTTPLVGADTPLVPSGLLRVSLLTR
jgi:hypothetical protein